MIHKETVKSGCDVVIDGILSLDEIVNQIMKDIDNYKIFSK